MQRPFAGVSNRDEDFPLFYTLVSTCRVTERPCAVLLRPGERVFSTEHPSKHIFMFSCATGITSWNHCRWRSHRPGASDPGDRTGHARDTSCGNGPAIRE